MRYCIKKTPLFTLSKLAIAFSILATFSSASATAVFDTSLQVTLSVSDTSGGNLQIFSIIDDDGTDPNTTYAFIDPDGSPGSNATSVAGVIESGSDPLNFSASTNGTTVGIDPIVPVSAYSNAATKGGFFVLNEGTSPINAIFTVAWTWATTIGADETALDSAMALTNLTFFSDGFLSGAPLSEVFETPNETGGSDSGQVQTILTVDPSGARIFAVALETTGLAQSIGKTQPLPEPGTLFLMMMGLFSFTFFGFGRGAVKMDR